MNEPVMELLKDRDNLREQVRILSPLAEEAKTVKARMNRYAVRVPGITEKGEDVAVIKTGATGK